MFRDLSALPSCPDTECTAYIHSHFAQGLFPYLFKHAPVNYLSRPSCRAVHLCRPVQTSHPCFFLSAVKKTYLWARGHSLVDLGSESRVTIASELYISSQRGSLEGPQLDTFPREMEWEVSGEGFAGRCLVKRNMCAW